MQKPILLLFSCLIIFSFSYVMPTNEELVWSGLKEISVKLKKQEKPVLIDLYTDWCHWCKVMDKKTYGNQKVINYLSKNFYVAKVNAETKDSLTWDTKTYFYNSHYLINEFALYATKGQPGFPTTVILPSENSQPISISGFLEPKELEPILKYFGEREYLTKTFTEYKKTFKPSW
ncbi:MAG: DUF255 domain-containing protein [Ginsengibacter sp.]